MLARYSIVYNWTSSFYFLKSESFFSSFRMSCVKWKVSFVRTTSKENQHFLRLELTPQSHKFCVDVRVYFLLMRESERVEQSESERRAAWNGFSDCILRWNGGCKVGWITFQKKVHSTSSGCFRVSFSVSFRLSSDFCDCICVVCDVLAWHLCIFTMKWENFHP